MKTELLIQVKKSEKLVNNKIIDGRIDQEERESVCVSSK